MSEWWTYSLSDFLLFAPRTYYRLFELYNADVWPLHILALGLGIVIVVVLLRGGGGGERHGRAVAAILAAFWLWVAWAYHAERYATINWAATWFAAGFAVQGVLLLWIGLVRGQLRFGAAGDAAARAGLGLFLFGLLLQPPVGWLAGRTVTQLEAFGMAPDPTAVATLGLLVLAEGRVRWELLVLPVLWCLVSGATLWTMAASDAAVMPLAAVLALALATVKTRRRARSRPVVG